MVKKASAKDTLTYYLGKYYPMQSRILLCYHPTVDSYWGDRCFYLDEKYNTKKPYNHRGILYNEVVIEFDDDDPKKNLEYANEVCRRLQRDHISFSKWYSGNKSTHIHCFLQFGAAKNVQLLKKCFMRHYAEGLPLPDLRLAVDGHLVRSEWGIHERSRKRKVLLFKHNDYPRASIIPGSVWKRYYGEMGRLVQRRVTTDVNTLTEHPGLKYILTAHQFREAEDGRERALFMLIHLLKPKHTDKAELTKYLQEWYRYSGGTKLLDRDIERKVSYHWNRDYNITERFLDELLESIGREDLIPGRVKSDTSDDRVDGRSEDHGGSTGGVLPK